MELTVTRMPVKPAERQPVCGHCWNQVNWCESFYKFGHDDGEDCMHTAQVVRALREAGYHAMLNDGGVHNTVIDEVGYRMADGSVQTVFADNVPEGTQVGYSDPREALPADIVSFLDNSFGIGEFFG
jgi:hypothetical protein